MTSIEQLITEMCETFNASPKSAGIKYIHEFPGTKQDIPLTSPIVSVGAERVAVTRKTADTTLSDSSSASVRLKFCICVPKSLSGRACYAVFDKLMAVTETLLSRYSLTKIVTEEMKYSSTVNGLILPVIMTVSLGNAYTPEQ